jgi:hypothetical protein
LLSDYVKVYERTLTPERCTALITRFEAAAVLQERREAERSYSFAELNVSLHWPEVEAEIFQLMMGCIQQYWQALQVGSSWPKKVDAERVRLKRYLPDGKDKFPTHVDVMNFEQSRRFLTAILYLNEPGAAKRYFPPSISS